MAFYAFVLEPPSPRTEFLSDSEGTSACKTGESALYEHAVMKVLMQFPEARDAIAVEVQRLTAAQAHRRQFEKPG